MRIAAERTSMRAVARDVGLTARALDMFLAGSTPRLSTQAKLRAWYVRHAAENERIDEHTARTAVSLLLAEVPNGAARERAEREMLELLERAHGKKPPKWIEVLRNRE